MRERWAKCRWSWSDEGRGSGDVMGWDGVWDGGVWRGGRYIGDAWMGLLGIVGELRWGAKVDREENSLKAYVDLNKRAMTACFSLAVLAVPRPTWPQLPWW